MDGVLVFDSIEKGDYILEKYASLSSLWMERNCLRQACFPPASPSFFFLAKQVTEFLALYIFSKH